MNKLLRGGLTFLYKHVLYCVSGATDRSMRGYWWGIYGSRYRQGPVRRGFSGDFD